MPLSCIHSLPVRVFDNRCEQPGGMLAFAQGFGYQLARVVDGGQRDHPSCASIAASPKPLAHF